ncbi:unnamed protein product [Mytilus edulis]|uniref:MULE transposase domain-containing protein n=1 Tax=Mytilus edulis TaxID=6550 RepID=A0A8S3RHH0_MYTED|nr:unnamed protein product [Mytilus edulis]
MAYVVQGSRGGKILIHEGYRYQKNRIRLNAIHWRCWRNTCRAPLRTAVFDIQNAPNNIDVLHVSEHDHQEDQETIDSASIRQRMVNHVSANPEVSGRQAYDNVVQQVPRNERDSIPTYDCIRSSLDRTRRKHIPPIPATINDVAINGRWCLTKDGDQFLSKLDNGWGIAVFCTREALMCLGDCNDIYIDATFKSVPRPYMQFLTIHGFYRDRVIPFVYALMTDKHIGSYRQIMRHIKRRYRRLTNNDLSPQNIVSDFETGMITAAETEFPKLGCVAVSFISAEVSGGDFRKRDFEMPLTDVLH